MSVPEWSERQDGQRKGGLSKETVVDGVSCKETLWNVRIDWPTEAAGRMMLRRYKDGRLTAKLGRIWPVPKEEEDDGA